MSHSSFNRRDFLKISGMSAAALGAFGCQQKPAQQKSKPPNIILLMADDVSAKDFEIYGHPENKTPVLQSLSNSGVQFKTCWATPICSPTRAEIMTGRYGFRTGWFHNAMKPTGDQAGANLSETNKIFAEFLKEAGYATAVCGKWQLTGTQEEFGFDEHCMWLGMEGALKPEWNYDGPIEEEGMSLPGRMARYWHPAIERNGELLDTKEDDYGPDIFLDFTIDFASRHKDQPFLVYFPMVLPHKSWDFEAGKSGYLPVPELDESGNKTGNKVPGSLKSNVEYMDSMLGRLTRELEKLGLRENTVILYTADNGTTGYGKGQWVMERGPRVPMVVNGPGVVKPQGAVDTLIDFSDVLPTLCDLAGVTIPDDYVVDGKTFADTLRGEKGDEREWIFSYIADRRMLRDKRWLLDGNDRFYDCNGFRNERGYKDVTGSNDPEVVAARKRFQEILKDLPAPTAEQEKYRDPQAPAPPPPKKG